MRLSRAARIAVAVAILLAAAAIVAVALRPPPPSVRMRIVVVDLQVSGGQIAQLFWSADMSFAEERSVRTALVPNGGIAQRLRFPIPARGVRWLRFDPSDAGGEMVIHRFQILEERGQIVDVPPASLRPANQIAAITPAGTAVRIETSPAANDPFLYVSVGCLEPPPVSVVTPFGLLLATAALVMLVTAAAAVTVRTVMAPLPSVSRRFVVLWLAAVVIIIFAAKLLLMQRNPALTPFWDQWDGEAMALFEPFDGCRLSWRAMFALHNEHRIFFPRLLALDLLLLNQQWDPRLEQVVNAMMHTGTAVLITSMLWLAGGRKRLDLAAALTALTFALPIGWENTLIGFQSAFYFLLLFSMLGLWLTTHYRTGSVSWVLGWVCAVCALFTAASGLLAAVVIGVVSVLRWAADRDGRRDGAINLAIAAGVFGVGYAVASPPLVHHEMYKVKTATEFLTALGRSLAWPRIGEPQLAVFAWLPMVLLAAGVLRNRLRSTELERLTMGLGAWVVFHAMALAYARGGGGANPATRYMDFLSIGFFANAMALTCVLDRFLSGTVARRAAAGALAVWLMFGIGGLNSLVRQSLTDLGGWRRAFALHTENVRRFVIGGDRSSIQGKTPMGEVPYPDANRLVGLLQDPLIRRILPAAIREPINLAPSVRTNDTFVPDGVYISTRKDPVLPSWGTFSASGNAASGRFESEPIALCELGHALRFDVAGHLGFDDHLLAVREVQTGRETAVVRRGPVRDGWSTATVSCPNGPFTIVAADNSRWSWFAFRPPVEIGWLSIAAERLIELAWPMLLSGLILMALAARWA